MALWQVEIFIVPKYKVKYDTDIDATDVPNLWTEFKIIDGSIEEIEKVLKRTRSWSEDILQLGKESETVIEVFYSEGMIQEITCRLDLRNIDIKIVDAILKFISTNNLSIIADRKVYVNPQKDSIIEIIKNSDAYRFLKNPEKFLEMM